MKNLLLAALAFFVFQSKMAAQKAPAQPEITFESEVVDFGTILQGDIVDTVFRFKNTGSKPLHISEAKGSCGCTRPTWPDRAIEPGKSGEIGIRFNSAKRAGDQTKTITVDSDAGRAVVLLKIIGFVTEPAKTPEELAAERQPADSSKTTAPPPERRHEIEKKGPTKKVGLTTIELTELEFDFGKVKEGEVVKHTFSFKNTGESVFFMSSLRDNCNCITLIYDEATLVQPGKTGEFSIEFNTAGQAGEHSKKILVGGNMAEQELPIILKGRVK